MIRFRLTELLSDRSFKEGRRIEWQEVAASTGIAKATISRMLNQRGYNASTGILDSLCRYFSCALGELAVYVPDAEIEPVPKKKSPGSKPLKARSK